MRKGPRDGMRIGNLPDGVTVIVRKESSEGSPTLEIQYEHGIDIKFRYPELGKK